MDWLKQNYDRAILGLAVLALLVCSGLIIVDTTNFPSGFEGRNSTKPPNNIIQPLPVESIATAAELTKKPRNWAPREGSLFVSRPYVLKDGKLIDPLAGNINLHDPIPNSWIIANELPWWESDLKDQDPDGDHFSNLEEFYANTNPRDPKSVPPYYTKLRLQKFISVPFRLKFNGMSDEGVYMINPMDKGGRTQFLKVGDMIEGTPYKLISYAPRTEKINDIDTDTSELTIENTETKQKIVLVTNKIANDPTSYAEFLYLYDNSTAKVKKDDEFSLPPEPDHKYKLIDISEDEAVIKDLQTSEEHKIPKVK